MEVKRRKVLARIGRVLTFLDASTNLTEAGATVTQQHGLMTGIVQINAFAQDKLRMATENVVAPSLSSAHAARRDTCMRGAATVVLHALTWQYAEDLAVANAGPVFTQAATRTNALTLIASAQAMVQTATSYAALFTANGVSLDAVTTAIQTLQSAVNAESSAQRVSKGATQGIVAQLKAGHGAVRLMDVVIRPLLAGNTPMLAQWKSVSRATGGLNLSAPVPVLAAVPSGTTASTPATATPSSTSAPAAPEPATADPAAAAA